MSDMPNEYKKNNETVLAIQVREDNIKEVAQFFGKEDFDITVSYDRGKDKLNVTFEFGSQEAEETQSGYSWAVDDGGYLVWLDDKFTVMTQHFFERLFTSFELVS